MSTNASGATVLIGFAESFAAIEATWSLQRAGFTVHAFGRTGARPPLRRAREVVVHPVTAPEDDADRWRLDVERVLADLRPDVYLPLDDAALWLSPRIDLGDCRFAGPPAAAAAVALDKAAQVERAAAAGLDVPPTEVVDSLDDVTVGGSPVFLKPADAVRVEDRRLVRPAGRVCATPAELAAARAAHRGGRMLVQPLVVGRGEGLFGSIGTDGATPWSAHRRVRMVNPMGSASSACESTDVDTALAAAVGTLLDGLSWRGLVMAEFLRDTAGRAWFMELNGRAWGSLALATARGFEYPAWAVQDVLGLTRSPEPEPNPPYVRSRHVGREILHLAFVLRGPSSAGVTVWPSRGGTIKSLLTVRRHDRPYNWNAGQADVLAADTWRTVAEQGRRLLRRRS